ncbi:MAG TPA: hypothetical protein VGQ28_05965 [Thermoanaerobaculia bacterium]|jgi:hypothetical protein|nr:hypothetical protein [Thermoanaerobaculia bacterium]
MRLIRTSVVLLVTVVLLAMSVPAAQARGLEKPQPSVHSQGGAWLAYSVGNALDDAMAWLARLAGSAPPAVSRTMKSTTTTTTTTTIPGGHYTPMTGPCIDPLGVGRCN